MSDFWNNGPDDKTFWDDNLKEIRIEPAEPIQPEQSSSYVDLTEFSGVLFKCKLCPMWREVRYPLGQPNLVLLSQVAEFMGAHANTHNN